MNKYAQFYAILNKNGFTKEEVIKAALGKDCGLSQLTATEYNIVLQFLEQFNRLPAGNPQRRKIIAIARQMQWGKGDFKAMLREIDTWLMKQKFQRPMMALAVNELNLMLAVLEQRVLPDYLTGLNK